MVRPDVEGLRGVAILLVVAYHAGLTSLAGGFVGVDVFFTLSGYLITGLLLGELAESGAIGVAAFYARRVRRLLPAAAVALGGTLLLAALLLPPRDVAAVAGSARAAATFASNVVFAARATDYFREGPTTDPLLHTWSLSVEEQFYLAWPCVVWLAAGRGADWRRLAWVLATLAAMSLAACWWYTFANRPTAFYQMPTRAWEFAVGALAAVRPATSGERLRAAPLGRIGANAAGWLGLALIAGAAVAFSDRTRFPGVHAGVPVLGTALVLASAAGSARGSVGRLLSAAALRWVGRHSYGWYLWHWPFLILGAAALSHPDVGTRAALVRVGLVLGALAAAVLTRHLVEEPVRRAPTLVARPRGTLALGLLGIAALWAGASVLERRAARAANGPTQRAFTAAVKDLPRPYRDGCNPDVTDSAVRVCAYGVRGARATVAVFGDSHAAQWFPAVERLATARGWQILVLTKSACPSVDVSRYAALLGRTFTECDTWRRAAVDSLRARRPALVLLSNSTEYVRGGPRPERDATVAPTEWQRGTERTRAALLDAAIPAAVVQDTPAARENVPRCLMRAAWRGHDPATCDFAAREAVHGPAARAVERAVARSPEVRLIDLTAALCPAGRCAAADTVVRYRDARHLTATASARLAPVLGAALDRTGLPRPTVEAR